MSAIAEQYDPTTGEILDSDAPDNGGWDKERHCATDLRGANWAGMKLREALQQLAKNEEMAEREIETLNRKMMEVRERLRRADAPFLQTQTFMENALRVFAETHRDEVLKGLRKKSRLLPCGVTIGWHAHKAGYRYDQRPGPDCGKPPTLAQNRERLLAWALKHEGEMESPNLTEPGPVQVRLDAVKARLDALYDPEQPRFTPPGLEYVPAGETLTVSVGEEESK